MQKLKSLQSTQQWTTRHRSLPAFMKSSSIKTFSMQSSPSVPHWRTLTRLDLRPTSLLLSQCTTTSAAKILPMALLPMTDQFQVQRFTLVEEMGLKHSRTLMSAAPWYQTGVHSYLEEHALVSTPPILALSKLSEIHLLHLVNLLQYTW